VAVPVGDPANGQRVLRGTWRPRTAPSVAALDQDGRSVIQETQRAHVDRLRAGAWRLACPNPYRGVVSTPDALRDRLRALL